MSYAEIKKAINSDFLNEPLDAKINRLNAILKDAGETITAGDLVGLINDAVYKAGPLSPTVFESANTTFISAVLVDTDKILVAYTDIGNSNFGTSVILSVNGTTISVGTHAVFESASTNEISAVKVDTDKVLVAYRDADNTNFGTSVILTISGTSITVGTPVVFESASTDYISAVSVDTNKVLVAYRDIGNSNFGTSIILDSEGVGFAIEPTGYSPSNSSDISGVEKVAYISF